MGTVFEVELDVQESTDFYFYRTLQRDYNSAVSVSNRASGKSINEWMSQITNSYLNFLSKGKQPPSFLSEKEKRLYQGNLFFNLFLIQIFFFFCF